MEGKTSIEGVSLGTWDWSKQGFLRLVMMSDDWKQDLDQQLGHLIRCYSLSAIENRFFLIVMLKQAKHERVIRM
jgi:hypothetical protein